MLPGGHGLAASVASGTAAMRPSCRLSHEPTQVRDQSCNFRNCPLLIHQSMAYSLWQLEALTWTEQLCKPCDERRLQPSSHQWRLPERPSVPTVVPSVHTGKQSEARTNSKHEARSPFHTDILAPTRPWKSPNPSTPANPSLQPWVRQHRAERKAQNQSSNATAQWL